MIYLDHAGSALVNPTLAQRYPDYCRQFPINPHGGTKQAEHCRRAALDAARRLLGCLNAPEEQTDVIWTSGGTEALNLAIRQVQPPFPLQAIAVDAAAHPAMLASAQERAEREHLPLHLISPLRPQDWEQLPPHTLACLCHANNETGAILNPQDIRRRLHHDAILVLDAAQSLGRLPLDFRTLGADLISLSSRKIGGPAPIGALVVRKPIRLLPLILGGGQQRGIRSGTLDVVGTILFADAAQLACTHLQAHAQAVRNLADRLWNGLAALAARHRHVRISPPDALPAIASFALPGFEGAVVKRLLAENHDIVIGTGSACSAETGHTSHVLKAMGLPDDLARAALRVSFSHDNSPDDIDRFHAALAQTLDDY